MRRSTRERGAVLLIALALFSVGAVMAVCFVATMKAESVADQQQLRTAQSLALMQGQFEHQLALYQHRQIHGDNSVRLAYDPYMKLPAEQPQPVVEADMTGFNIKFQSDHKTAASKHEEKSETFILHGGATFRPDAPNKAGYNNVFIKISN